MKRTYIQRTQAEELPAKSKQQYERSERAFRQSLKARADIKRTWAERLADQMTAGFGSMPFLLGNMVWFAVWIVVNLGLIHGLRAFDPFPFGLLTMIVSLEAIVLAIVVLISQNRAARIADLREEVALQVEEISEREVTKLLELMVRLLREQGVSVAKDEELRAMLRATDTDVLTAMLEQEV